MTESRRSQAQDMEAQQCFAVVRGDDSSASSAASSDDDGADPFGVDALMAELEAPIEASTPRAEALLKSSPEVQESAAPPDAAGEHLFEFECPEGVTPGQLLQVTSPSGKEIELYVPEGVAPGDLIQVADLDTPEEEEEEGNAKDVVDLEQVLVEEGLEDDESSDNDDDEGMGLVEELMASLESSQHKYSAEVDASAATALGNLQTLVSGDAPAAEDKTDQSPEVQQEEEASALRAAPTIPALKLDAKLPTKLKEPEPEPDALLDAQFQVFRLKQQEDHLEAQKLEALALEFERFHGERAVAHEVAAVRPVRKKVKGRVVVRQAIAQTPQASTSPEEAVAAVDADEGDGSVAVDALFGNRTQKQEAGEEGEDEETEEESGCDDDDDGDDGEYEEDDEMESVTAWSIASSGSTAGSWVQPPSLKMLGLEDFGSASAVARNGKEMCDICNPPSGNSAILRHRAPRFCDVHRLPTPRSPTTVVAAAKQPKDASGKASQRSPGASGGDSSVIVPKASTPAEWAAVHLDQHRAKLKVKVNVKTKKLSTLAAPKDRDMALRVSEKVETREGLKPGLSTRSQYPELPKVTSGTPQRPAQSPKRARRRTPPTARRPKAKVKAVRMPKPVPEAAAFEVTPETEAGSQLDPEAPTTEEVPAPEAPPTPTLKKKTVKKKRKKKKKQSASNATADRLMQCGKDRDERREAAKQKIEAERAEAEMVPQSPKLNPKSIQIAGTGKRTKKQLVHSLHAWEETKTAALAVKRQREREERTKEEDEFRERKLEISEKASSIDRTFQHLLDATEASESLAKRKALVEKRKVLLAAKKAVGGAREMSFQDISDRVDTTRYMSPERQYERNGGSGGSSVRSRRKPVSSPKKSPRKPRKKGVVIVEPQELEPEPELEPEAFLWEAMDRMCGGITSKRQAREAFRKFDKDSSGELDARGLKTALRHMTLGLNDQQIEVVMAYLDKDGDGSISIHEFMGIIFGRKLEMVTTKLQVQAYSNGGVDLAMLFRHYDQDNTGELEFDEFRKLVRKDVGRKANEVTDEELREMFDHVDADGGGTIGLVEFKHLLQKRSDDGAGRFEAAPGQVFNKILEYADEHLANVMHLFRQFDADSSGGLERKEFKLAMKELGMKLTASEMQQVMNEMGRDGDGFIDTKELSDRMRLAKKDRRTHDSPKARKTRKELARQTEDESWSKGQEEGEEDVVAVDSTPLQQTLEALTGMDAEPLEVGGTTMVDQIDDALVPNCDDLELVQTLLGKIQASDFRHVSVASLEMKRGVLEEKQVWAAELEEAEEEAARTTAESAAKAARAAAEAEAARVAAEDGEMVAAEEQERLAAAERSAAEPARVAAEEEAVERERIAAEEAAGQDRIGAAETEAAEQERVAAETAQLEAIIDSRGGTGAR